MENSNLPFLQHFSNLRENPKWGLKLIISIIVAALSAAIGAMSIDYNEIYQEAGANGEAMDMDMGMIGLIVGIVGGAFSSIIGIGVTFVIFLIISKIMKSDAGAKSIFSATLSFSLITGIVGLIVVLIQWVAGLSLLDYNIASLNIFDKGNQMLGALNLQTLIDAYVFGIMLFATNRLSKKAAMIWAIAYIVVSVGFALIGASFQ
ncbi:hypothetical protein AABD37_08545 [Staphylococcus nepalensis]|uniref:hypothetical protein n=1 Tax=Staphylococcus nepalensis TaxID=214473 RepID=UPI003016DB51